ncbi:MAG: tryptophan 7-halogenase [Planctomycetota bacterium]
MDSLASNDSILVIGGGPGGSAAATVLARNGRSVVLFERERFPRFHVGESLLPYSNAILERLGVAAALDAKGYVTKRGGTFETECGTHRSRLDFTGARGLARPTTYHVPRDEFDALLLDNARAAGVVVVEAARVTRVETEPGRATLTWTGPAGEQRTRGRAVLDASGRAGVVAKARGLRVADPALRKAALFAHFTGAAPLAHGDPGDIHVVARADGGWAWLVPLDRGRTSVGFVFDHAETMRFASESPADALARWIASTPAVARRLEAAERCNTPRWEGNFAYSAKAFAGDGWALIGDAAAFLDPVFSTGIHLALSHGVEVADDVERALARGHGVTARSLRRSEQLQRRRLSKYRHVVTGFYSSAFRDLFFQPGRWPEGVRAMAALLAGVDRLSLPDRLRVRGFRALVALNERLHFVPRVSVATAPSAAISHLQATP